MFFKCLSKKMGNQFSLPWTAIETFWEAQLPNLQLAICIWTVCMPYKNQAFPHPNLSSVPLLQKYVMYSKSRSNIWQIWSLKIHGSELHISVDRFCCSWNAKYTRPGWTTIEARVVGNSSSSWDIMQPRLKKKIQHHDITYHIFLEPQNPSINEVCVFQKRRIAGFEALKL